MKPLPVIQPHSTQNAEARPLQTAGIVHDPTTAAALEPRIMDALRTVFDPEIPVNIYDLGLIYEVVVDSDRRVGIRMTLTAPACLAAQSLPDRVRQAVEGVPDVTEAIVDLVWEPAWTRERMSEAAKLQLGLF